jgi:cytochrome c oxidase subunit 4
MEHQVSNSSSSGNKKTHEGPGKHYITFIVSILLTVVAFYAVGAGWIQDPTTLIIFILVLAVIQAAAQLFVWMHLKDKGHAWPAILLFSGLLVAVITVAALILWVWW